MSEHKTNPVWKPHERVTKEYAESYNWWQEFLTARLNAIDAMKQLNKTNIEILNTLNLNDTCHIERLSIMINLNAKS